MPAADGGKVVADTAVVVPTAAERSGIALAASTVAAVPTAVAASTAVADMAVVGIAKQ